MKFCIVASNVRSVQRYMVPARKHDNTRVYSGVESGQTASIQWAWQCPECEGFSRTRTQVHDQAIHDLRPTLSLHSGMDNLCADDRLHSSSKTQHDTRHSTGDITIIQPTGFTPLPESTKIHHKVLHIATKCVRASLGEDDVICAQESEHRHVSRAEVLLPSRIKLKICATIVEGRQLCLGGALAGEQHRVKRVRPRAMRHCALRCTIKPIGDNGFELYRVL
jgi:hypothetical protein